MIKYSLNYYEELCAELNNKRIIFIGRDHTDLDINKEIQFLYPYVDYCLMTDSVHQNYVKFGEKFLKIQSLDSLSNIDLTSYILFIASEYVDYIKFRLGEFEIKFDIKCYSLHLHHRFYLDINNNILNRYIEPAMYWYSKMLEIRNMKVDDSKRLMEIRKSEISSGHLKVIPRLIVTLTTKCNLNCLECIALTPHYKRQFDIPLKIIIESLSHLFDIVDYCSCIELIGGEPFLYPQINNVLQFLLKSEKVELVQITTNGLIMPKSDTLKLLANNKIILRISDYELSNLVNVTCEQFAKHKIKFCVQKNLAWMPIGNLQKKDKNELTLCDEYAVCFEGINCKNLFEGKIFNCTFASRLYDLKICNNVEFLNILQEENLSWKTILDFWVAFPSKACSYCEINNPNTSCVKCAVQK